MVLISYLNIVQLLRIYCLKLIVIMKCNLHKYVQSMFTNILYNQILQQNPLLFSQYLAVCTISSVAIQNRNSWSSLLYIHNISIISRLITDLRNHQIVKTQLQPTTQTFKALLGNLGSWFLVCNIVSIQLDEI